MVRVGSGWRWYGLAAIIPAALAGGAAGVNIVVGAHIAVEIDWTDPIVALPIMFMLGGVWEEPGWTGFALPRLAERFGNSPSGTIAATANDWTTDSVLRGVLWCLLGLGPVLGTRLRLGWPAALVNAPPATGASGRPAT